MSFLAEFGEETGDWGSEDYGEAAAELFAGDSGNGGSDGRDTESYADAWAPPSGYGITMDPEIDPTYLDITPYDVATNIVDLVASIFPAAGEGGLTEREHVWGMADPEFAFTMADWVIRLFEDAKKLIPRFPTIPPINLEFLFPQFPRLWDDDDWSWLIWVVVILAAAALGYKWITTKEVKVVTKHGR